jgi:hypothetical protein
MKKTRSRKSRDTVPLIERRKTTKMDLFKAVFKINSQGHKRLSERLKTVPDRNFRIMKDFVEASKNFAIIFTTMRPYFLAEKPLKN